MDRTYKPSDIASGKVVPPNNSDELSQLTFPMTEEEYLEGLQYLD
ncbi:MAG: hypothetical protein WBA12_13415 [Catalinimonas sp.]